MTEQKRTEGHAMLVDETFMSVGDLKTYLTEREMAKASKAVEAMDRAEEARKEFIRKLSTRIDINADRIRGLLNRVKSVAELGQRELLLGRFPVELCTDHGRAINQSEPDWPDTLTGLPRQAYEVWKETLQPLGYGFKAEIVDWPDGLPGDAGLYLTWN
jgi:hypothetical protein